MHRETENASRKRISLSLICFELRNITANPYVHIFGLGMPVLLVLVFSRLFRVQIPNAEIAAVQVTGTFLGIGGIIPMAELLVGYAATYSQELEKGIPQRMELFGIDAGMTILSRGISELVFLALSLILYFAVGIFALAIKAPTARGLVCYIACIAALGLICFALAHAIATLFRKFSIVYCITMMLYFGAMFASGMMGITYEMMPSAVQACARLLPTMYISRDFTDIWLGREYQFMPMLQAYLFTGALSGLLLLYGLKRGR